MQSDASGAGYLGDAPLQSHQRLNVRMRALDWRRATDSTLSRMVQLAYSGVLIGGECTCDQCVVLCDLRAVGVVRAWMVYLLSCIVRSSTEVVRDG